MPSIPSAFELRRFIWRSHRLPALLVLGGLLLAASSSVVAERLTPAEEQARLAALRAELDARGATFEIERNALTTIPWEEFEQRYLGLRVPPGLILYPVVDDHGIHDRDLPAAWDWREHGGAPGIRHQGACGSCWGFSAAAALESAIMLAVGFEVDVSEQHILVCNDGGSSCSGGWMIDAYEVWQDYGAIAEEDYPYQADDTLPCEESSHPPIAAAGTVHDVGYTVSDIKQAIFDHGAVSTTMMVYPDLVPYAGGCYTHDCPSGLNHAVALVGWDDAYCDGAGAWIMKNSWGEDWGVDGYAYLRYDAACIGSNATYVDYVPIADLLGINHEPLAHTTNTTLPYAVAAELISTGGTILLAESYVAYRIDNGAWIETPFGLAGGTNAYEAAIPPQPAGTKVEYYLHAEDSAGNVKQFPLWGSDDAITFIVGELELIDCEEFEAPSGWTVGLPDDDATTGIWERTDPEATYSDGYMIQPEDDYTAAPGQLCFVTGGEAGSSVGANDVDGGKTTLLSPVYDLGDCELVVIDYRRWYTNRRGSNPYADIWEVSVRSGASGWIPIEYTSVCRENWSHQVHILNDFVALGSDVQLRFVACDEDEGSLVEAAVDDLQLFAVQGAASDVADVPAHRRALQIVAHPNPCRTATTVSFRLPPAVQATVAIVDCAGRHVRTLYQGTPAQSGRYQAAWDGRDDGGRAVASGVYLVTARAAGEAHAKALMLLR